MTRRQIRQARKHPAKRVHIDLPPEDNEPIDDDRDDRIPIGPTDVIEMREGPPLDLRAPWQFPTN